MTTVAELEKVVNANADELDKVVKAVADVVGVVQKLEERISVLEKGSEQLAGQAGEELISLRSDVAALQREFAAMGVPASMLEGSNGTSLTADVTRLARVEQMLGIAHEKPVEGDGGDAAEDDGDTDDVEYDADGNPIAKPDEETEGVTDDGADRT